jgi:hypothetical protein
MVDEREEEGGEEDAKRREEATQSTRWRPEVHR